MIKCIVSHQIDFSATKQKNSQSNQIRNAPKSSGFTILEVIVALTIFAASVISIITVFSTGVYQASLLESHSQALVLAQAKMDEIILASDLDAIETQGKFKNSNYSYSMDISEFPVPGNSRTTQLMHIVLNVNWNDGLAGDKDSFSIEYLKAVAKK